MRKVLLGLALLLSPLGYVHAEEPACAGNPGADWALARASVEKPDLKFVALDKEDATVVVVNYNSLEPVSFLRPDEVFILIPSPDQVYVVFVSGSCILGWGQTTMAGFTTLLTPKPKA